MRFAHSFIICPIWQQTSHNFLNDINTLVFVTQNLSVFCEVGSWLFYVVRCTSGLKELKLGVPRFS